MGCNIASEVQSGGIHPMGCNIASEVLASFPD